MNEERVKTLIDRLKTTLVELENEVKSNPAGYLEGVTYEDILQYITTNDDDGQEGL